ncbi:MAG: hypothetical protein AABX51_02055 [Nanoarchaeota archaeon]
MNFKPTKLKILICLILFLIILIGSFFLSSIIPCAGGRMDPLTGKQANDIHFCFFSPENIYLTIILSLFGAIPVIIFYFLWSLFEKS